MKIVDDMNMSKVIPAPWEAVSYHDRGVKAEDALKEFKARELAEAEIDSVIAGTQNQRGLGIAIPRNYERKIAQFTASPWGGKVYETYMSRGAPVNNHLAQKLWDKLIRYGEAVVIRDGTELFVERTSSALPVLDNRGEVATVLYRDEDDNIFDVSTTGAVAEYVSIAQPIFSEAALTSIARLWTISAAGVLAAEVYHSPARYLINVDPDEIQDVTAAIGRTIAIGPPPEGEPEAKLQELAGGNPKVFDELSSSESSRLALATGIPVSALTPSMITNMSYETTLLSEKSFVDRIRVIQNLVIDVCERFTGERPVFGYVQQQQISAVADGVTKLVTAGILAPDSDFVKKLLQMTQAEAEDNAAKLSSGSATLQSVIESLGTGSDVAEPDAVVALEGDDDAGTI